MRGAFPPVDLRAVCFVLAIGPIVDVVIFDVVILFVFLCVCVLRLDVPLMFDVHSRKKKKRESVMTTQQ
jgi:hypothetical protein